MWSLEACFALSYVFRFWPNNVICSTGCEINQVVSVGSWQYPVFHGGMHIFRALHSSTQIYIRDLFEEKDKIYNLRSTVSLKQPKCNTITYTLNSFQYKSAKIWNDLPNKMARTKVSLQYVHTIAIECSWSKTH